MKINAERLLEEAIAYRNLGLPDEAEATLRRVMEYDSPAAHDSAQQRLIYLLMAERRFEEAISLGEDLIARGVFNFQAVINTMLSLNFLGRVGEAQEILKLVEKCGYPFEQETYQRACFASLLGDFPEALHLLLSEFRRSREYYSYCFWDTDLTPFWGWLGECSPTLEQAHFIIETPFREVCSAALAEVADAHLSAGDLMHLPERMQRLFRYDYKPRNFVINPLAAAGAPDAVADLLRLRKMEFDRVEKCIWKTHGRAMEMVLDAQPRYAAEHAQWGNHLGARYHILWALPLKPLLISDFLSQPGLEMMRPLLDEYVSANQQDPGFGKRMHAVWECMDADTDKGWALLDKTPAALRETGIYQLRLAALYQADKDFERTLPIWSELRRRWPNDAIGFCNAILALQALGREDEARRLLAEAPACCHRFRIYLNQVVELGQQGKKIPSRPAKFCGNPDLGGLLIPEAKSKPGNSPLRARGNF